MALVRRTPPPHVPYCIIAHERWGMLRTMKVPEEWIFRLCQDPRLKAEDKWIVLGKDTDIPMELGPGQEWKKPEPKPHAFYPKTEAQDGPLDGD